VIAGTTSVPVIASAGAGVLAIAYQNQLTGMASHVYLATSIDSGATWTYTHTLMDGGIGSAVTPAIADTVVATKPGAVVVWTDFRAGTGVNGDVYSSVSH
jgi:hypothetical protein